MKLNSFFLYLPFIFISCLLFESCFNSTKSVVGTLVGIAFDKGYIDGINQFMRMTNTDIYGGYIHRAGTWHQDAAGSAFMLYWRKKRQLLLPGHFTSLIWKDDDTFFLNLLFLHGGEFDFSFDFTDTGVDISLDEPLTSYQICGELQNKKKTAIKIVIRSVRSLYEYC